MPCLTPYTFHLHEQTGFPHWFSPRVPVSSQRCLVPLSYDRACYGGAAAQQQACAAAAQEGPQTKKSLGFCFLTVCAHVPMVILGLESSCPSFVAGIPE